jgi:hypothetical protein
MALTDVEKLRLLIGDTEGSPFYPLFSDIEIQFFLDSYGSVAEASKIAAISASFQLAAWNTRERTGDIEVWNELSKQYLKALENLIGKAGSGGTTTIPNGIMPYAGGISWADVNANNANLDNVRPALSHITICGDDPIGYL